MSMGKLELSFHAEHIADRIARATRKSNPHGRDLDDNGISSSFADINIDGVENRYINLLDFSKFGGFHNLSTLTSYDTSEMGYPWFADIVYTWKTPLPHKYSAVHAFVLDSQRVQTTIDVVARETCRTRKQVVAHARGCLARMKASLSKFICRICGYLLYKVFRRVMRRLLVNPSQLVKLQQAEKAGIPIIYLPLHKSHLDYLLITWTVWHFGLQLPHIASGDNLNLSGFGWLLRATGAFFIHRSTDEFDETNKSAIYRAVLNSYMIEILRAGMPTEFFLEGTRSRFGKVLLPKNGLISNVVEAVESGVLKDVYIVPVSYTYDNTVEGIFHAELMGIRKERESVFTVIKGIVRGFGARARCGTVTLDFGKPRSMVNYLSSLKSALLTNKNGMNVDEPLNTNSYRELLPWFDLATPRRTLIKAVGFGVVYAAFHQQPITINSLASLLLLYGNNRKRVPLMTFIRDLNLLCQEVYSMGYKVVGWDMSVESDDVFRYAIRVLSSVIVISKEHATSGMDGTWIAPHVNHHAVIDLCYRKNQALAPYSLISIVAISILGHEGLDLNKINEAPIDDIVTKALILCDLLHMEIIFTKPCDNLSELLKATVQELITSAAEGVCTYKGVELSFALSFYANILRQFLQTLSIVLDWFIRNPLSNPVDRREIDFIRRFLLEKSTSRDPTLFSEAYNSDSVYNSIKLLRFKSIVARNRLELINEDQARHVLDILSPYIRDQ